MYVNSAYLLHLYTYHNCFCKERPRTAILGIVVHKHLGSMECRHSSPSYPPATLGSSPRHIIYALSL